MAEPTVPKSNPLPRMQKAIRLHAPHNVQVDDIPVPQIEHADDAIVKVLLAGLCGSDLHPYRGHECKDMPPFVMGHELYGEIVRLGSSFASEGATDVDKRPSGYTTYQMGMRVISTFSVSCLECEYCTQGFTSRCTHAQLLGSPTLPGAQAQYIRIPKAGGTLIPIHSDHIPASNTHADGPSISAVEEQIISPEIAILLADIFPTGHFAALQAFHHPNLAFPLGRGIVGLVDRTFAEETIDMLEATEGPSERRRLLTFAVIGLGPVGVCALVTLIDFMLVHLDASQSPSQTKIDGKGGKSIAFRVLAIDLLESRRIQAQDVVRRMQDPRIGVSTEQGLGASESESTRLPIQVEFLSPDQALPNSCHAVLEVVGHPSALTLSASVSRPFGIISSVGVHSHPTFPIPTPLLYDKNLSFAFGRCPVRSLVPRSKEVLERRRAAFEGFVERVVGIGEAVAAYERFERGEGGKACFDPWG